MVIEIKNEELERLLGIEKSIFGKYISPLINEANKQSKGTRPGVVGQMSDLIQEFKGSSLEEWEEWYVDKNPESINNATEIIMKMIDNFKDALNKIDRSIVEQWVKDLVIGKTFLGLRIQEAILKKGAAIKGTDYRLAPPENESKGIDGYIGDVPVSIKPDTYKLKAALPEIIKVKMISYKKVKGGIEVDFTEVMGKRELANLVDVDLGDFD